MHLHCFTIINRDQVFKSPPGFVLPWSKIAWNVILQSSKKHSCTFYSDGFVEILEMILVNKISEFTVNWWTKYWWTNSLKCDSPNVGTRLQTKPCSWYRCRALKKFFFWKYVFVLMECAEMPSTWETAVGFIEVIGPSDSLEARQPVRIQVQLVFSSFLSDLHQNKQRRSTMSFY